MSNGRCRMHGGKSTGPRTPEGLERMRRANTRHGNYSEESRQLTRAVRLLIAEALRSAEATMPHAWQAAGLSRSTQPDELP
jgi:hypothetical protein